MSRFQVGVGDEPIEFFIFDSISQIFFHIFERADWKISDLPYDQLQQQVNETYVACNAIQAQYPHFPSPEQKAAMTDSLKWAREASSPPKYQLEMYFDPRYRDSSFVSCFNDKITDWIDEFSQAQQDHDIQFLVLMLAGFAAVGIFCGLGFMAYKQYQKYASQQEATSSSSATLFSKTNKEEEEEKEDTENTYLLENARVPVNQGGFDMELNSL